MTEQDQALLDRWTPERISTLEPLERAGYLFSGELLPDAAHEKNFFLHRELDSDHVAFLIGELVGDGLTALVFRAQLSALFLAHFSRWHVSDKAERQDVRALACHMNDLTHTMKLAGWASLKLGLVTFSTGEVALCAPGWKMHHIFRHETRSQMMLRGSSTPSVGTHPAEDFDPVCQANRLTLAPGDALLCLGEHQPQKGSQNPVLNAKILRHMENPDATLARTFPYSMVWLLKRRL
ncbi:MAG: hypothetical protein WCG80_12305 [Spirochaetales bacterium]